MQKTERNREIRRLKRKGFTHRKLGEVYGISLQRVGQIVTKKRRINMVIKEEVKPIESGPELLNIAQARRMLNLHTNTIRRYTDIGIIPVYRIGTRGDRRFKRTDLQKFLEGYTNDRG